MSILSRILAFESENEEMIYFLKLEALWILINLSMCDTEEAKLILSSEFTDARDYEEEENGCSSRSTLLSQAEQDLNWKKSEILSKIEGFIDQSLDKNRALKSGCCDMKVLSLVIHFYGNMVASGPEYS